MSGDNGDEIANKIKAKKRQFVSISAVFVEHGRFLKRFLARFVSEQQDIEDVAQEAYLRAYAAEQKKSGIEHPKAFLFHVAKNVALQRLTSKSAQITDYIEETEASLAIGVEASAEQEAEAEAHIGLYCDAVASLPEKCRQVFLLRKIHGLAHKEIAERMGLSLSSVEKYVRQGIVTCRDYLAEREEYASNQISTLEFPHGRGKSEL